MRFNLFLYPIIKFERNRGERVEKRVLSFGINGKKIEKEKSAHVVVKLCQRTTLTPMMLIFLHVSILKFKVSFTTQDFCFTHTPFTLFTITHKSQFRVCRLRQMWIFEQDLSVIIVVVLRNKRKRITKKNPSWGECYNIHVDIYWTAVERLTVSR